MTGIVIRLAGIQRPETKLFQQSVITIGTAPDCDLLFEAEGHQLPADAVLLTLGLAGGTYRVTALDPRVEVTRHGEKAVVGDPIYDGDTFYFGESGVRLRIFALTDAQEFAESLELGTAVLAHSRRASLAVNVDGERLPAAPRTDVAIIFVKQLLRELVAEIPRRLLYAIVALGILLIGTIVYINTLSFLEGRRNNQAISDVQKRIDDIQKDMSLMREDVRAASDQSKFVLSTVSAAARIVENYGPGVCLITGTYTFIDPRAGRPARFREPSEANNPNGPIGPNGVNLSVDGSGPVYEVEFIGTGFLVEKGLVLTNRHVVQPWLDDPIVSMIRAQGFQPRMKELYQYFPKLPQAFPLRLLEVSSSRDIALCAFDQGEREIPVLPLDEIGEGAVSGQLVVLIGYPAGIDGLLARIDEGATPGFDPRRNTSLRQVLNELAARSQIRPQSTQGHIGDISSARLVYDAQTGEGGSGGPVFGSNGKVIGINQAILPGTPSNFGVPIRYGLDLLRKHSPEHTAEAADAARAPAKPGTSN
jgi:S1-C subfamily serine protease